MPRRPEVLTDINDAALEYTLETPQPERIPGSSLSRAVYLHRSGQERWLAKSPVQQNPSLTRQFVLREKIANDIYAYYGVNVPRLAFADLPCEYIGMDKSVRDMYVKELKLTQAPHLLSRWLDRFNSYSYMPLFTGGQGMQLNVDDQLVPERGLGHILAVAHFIQDIDVIGGSGDNIGYKLSVTADGLLYAHSCKIDPGEAFFEFDQASAHTVTPKIRLATAHPSQTYVAFDQLPQQTQQEFLSTVRDILQTPVTDLERFFQRKGSESLQKTGFTAKAITTLKARQAGLAEVFKAELLADEKARPEAKEPKEPKIGLSAVAKLPEELRPLYAQVLLEQGNPIYQQAAHFYVKHSTTEDHRKGAKRQPFGTMLSAFLRDREVRVLLLLGDSGFGKSTVTQRITQIQWRSYLRDAKMRVAIRIELKQFSARTVKRCIDNALLDDYHLTAAQIAALKQRPCLILLDGFDEIAERTRFNLWNSHGLSQWRDVKLIITSRAAYLNPEDISQYFYPDGRKSGLQQQYLAPFNPEQIEAYLAKALAELPAIPLIAKKAKEVKEEKALPIEATAAKTIPESKVVEVKEAKQEVKASKEIKKKAQEAQEAQEPRRSQAPTAISDGFISSWLNWLFSPYISLSTETLRLALPTKTQAPTQAQELASSGTLQSLLQVPLMLKIFSDALPTLLEKQSDLRQLNRFDLYEAFMAQWFERNRVRLSQNLGQLVSPAQCAGFLTYSQDLAFALFKAEQIQIDYAPGQAPWDRFFSDSSPEIIQLRSGCPLRRAGQQYSFIHKSFYEFFLAQRIVRLASTQDKPALITYLSVRSFTQEPQVLLFLSQARQAGRLNETAVDTLLAVVTDSAKQPTIAQASANAATILNACQVSLSCQQWQGIQLPGADLRYSVLAHSDLSGANLRGATLMRTLLYETNLSGADLRDVQWGEWTKIALTKRAVAIAHHPTEPWLAVAQGDEVVLIHAVTGEPIGEPLRGHRNTVRSIAFSPDGRHLVSAGGSDCTLCLWDVPTQQALGEPLRGHTKTIRSVAFSPDGQHIVSGSDDHTLRLWDVATQQALGKPLQGHTGSVTSVAFSPNGQHIVSGSGDNTLQLWDLATQQMLGEPFLGHTDPIRSVAFSPNGQRIVSGSYDNTLRLWDVASQRAVGEPLRGHTGTVRSVAFSPDGRRVVSGSQDHTLRLWDVTTQQPLGEPLRGHTGSIWDVSFSLDGRCVVSGSNDYTLRLWDVTTQRSLGKPLWGHTESVTSVAFSPDGRRLVSAGGSDYTLHLWDVVTQQALGEPLRGHTNTIKRVNFSRDGRYVTSESSDNTSRNWDVATPHTLNKPLRGETPGEELLRSYNDKLRRNYKPRELLWDEALSHSVKDEAPSVPPSMKCEPNKPSKEYKDLIEFSPNGRRFVLGSKDYSLCLWDVGTQTCLAVVDWYRVINCAAFTPAVGVPLPFVAKAERSAIALLAIGDDSGMISFWMVQKEAPYLRCVGVPRQPGMTLWAKGANLKDCLMDESSKRLLAQQGAEAETVKLVEAKVSRMAEPAVVASTGVEIKREHKVAATTILAPVLSLAAISSASSSASVSASAGAISPSEDKDKKEVKAPSRASSVTSHSSASSSSSVSSAALSSSRSTLFSVSSSASASAIAVPLPAVQEVKSTTPPAVGQALFAAPSLAQQVGSLMDHLSHELKKQRTSYDPQAAASFSATLLAALRKNQLPALLENPEDYGLPSWLAPVVNQYLKAHPLLSSTITAHPAICKQLEVQLMRHGRLETAATTPALT